MENNISYCLDLYYELDFYYSNIDRVSVLIDKLFISKNKKIDYNVIASLFKTHPRNIKNLKTKQYIK